MKDGKDWVTVGRFGRPHGLKGCISVYSFTDPPDNILSYSDWYVLMNGHWTLMKRFSTEEHNRFIAASIEGYSEREDVARLTNLEIAVKSCQLPELAPGEYYWHDLVGMAVLNVSGQMLGTVTEIIATGSNDVLVVVGDERYLIPYRLGTVVLDVCVDKRQLTVDWGVDFL